jgi:hypothetical protein
VSGANNRTTTIPSFTTGDVSIFRQALYKDGATKITKDLRLHGLLPESVEFLSPSQAGYENGIGMMSAEARMAASEKGYENGLGAMSAEERMAARKKGDTMGIAWERKYAEFKLYEGMPETGTTLYTWQQSQLSNTHPSCLNAKIREEIEENKGSTVWRERRVKLSDCVVQKNRDKMGIAWERKYAEFKLYEGMPEKGTTLYNWQHIQLGNTHPSCLNAKFGRRLKRIKGEPYGVNVV